MRLNIKKIYVVILVLLTIALCKSINVSAAPYNGQECKFSQPDGSKVKVKVFGDEFYQRVESIDGYTLVREPDTHWVCYAQLNDEGSDFISTGIRYTGGEEKADMASKKSKEKIKKGLRLEKKHVLNKVKKNKDSVKWDEFLKTAPAPTNDGMTSANASIGGIVNNTMEGKINGLTILIEFPDVKSSISRDEIIRMLNSRGYTGYGNNGSVRDYFYDVSNGKLEYTNTITAFYTAKHAKYYYDNPVDGYGAKTQELILEALNYLEATGFDFSSLSTDADGFVRALNIMYAGSPDYGWCKGLWPHSSGIYAYQADGVKLSRYQITNIGDELYIGVFAHENGHLLCGWPDTYDYEYDSAGAGMFDLMSTNIGRNPLPPNPYFRCVLAGWGTLKDLAKYSPGSQITLVPNDNGACIYRNRNYANEFFMAESIKRTGRRSFMPGEGLLIWHIDENGYHDYNQMTPDNHFQVSVEQADGQFQLEKNFSSGDYADFFYAGYKDRFDNSTLPDSKWWNGTVSYLEIGNVNAEGTQFEIGGSLTSDNQPPSAPQNLWSVERTNSSITLQWNASADNVGVYDYVIYSNGNLAANSTNGMAEYTIQGLSASTQYDFTVKAVDYSGNISPASDVLSARTKGMVTREYWRNIQGDKISDIPLNTAPNGREEVNSLTGYNNWSDNYAERIKGYLWAPETREYTFWISGDDNCELWLSTDEAPGNKVRIAYVPGWTNQGIWNKYPEQKSDPIILQAGKKYYIEVLHKESGWDDHVEVAWDGYTQGNPDLVDGGDLSNFDGNYDTQAPTAPANLRCDGKTDTSLILTWNASSDNVGIGGYDILLGTEIIGSTNGETTYTVYGLLQNTSYIFTVRARDIEGNISPLSNVLTASTNTGTTYRAIPGRIEAEDYSGMYGIKIENTLDTDGGKDIGWVDTGDWMDYNINVMMTGLYSVEFRVSNGLTGVGQLQLRKADGTVIGTASIPATGGWQNWTTVSTTVSLDAGVQTLRVYASGNPWDLNWMNFTIRNNIIPGRIEAEDFISMYGIQVENTADIGGGKDIGWVDTGDWMDFKINAQKTGSYKVEFRVSNGLTTPGQLQLRKADGAVLGIVSIPATGGWQNWTTVSTTISLDAGIQTIRVYASGNPWDLNWMDFTYLNNSVPGKIEAEDYFAMMGIQLEDTADAGGGKDIGWVDTGDWMDYNMNVQRSGTFTVEFRVSNGLTTPGQLQLRKADGTVLCSVSIPVTGDWQNWTTVSATVNLAAGQQTLRVYASGNPWDLNWMNFK